MLNQAFLKRILPFIITLTLGLFVASFFVSLMPNFKFKKNRCGKRQEVKMLRHEKQQLELENQRLKERLVEAEKMILLEAPIPLPPPSMKQK